MPTIPYRLRFILEICIPFGLRCVSQSIVEYGNSGGVLVGNIAKYFAISALFLESVKAYEVYLESWVISSSLHVIDSHEKS